MRFRFRICFLLQPLLYFISRALNHVPAFLAKPFSRINNSIRIWLADPLLDYVVDASKLCDRFKNMKNNTETIGRRVWMFWYSGFDTAPALVQKCIEQVRSIPDIEMVLLTKDNLELYYLDFWKIRPMLESGRISIQHFSDLLRCYLLKEYGGAWLDATIFVLDGKFFSRHCDELFWSVKYKESNFFNEGKYSGFLMGAGKQNALMIMAYDLLTNYFEYFNSIFDYFQIDFVIYYLYRHFKVCREMIDEVPVCTEVYDMWEMANNRENTSSSLFDLILSRNAVQKITYRDSRSKKALATLESVYNRLLHYGDNI